MLYNHASDFVCVCAPTINLQAMLNLKKSLKIIKEKVILHVHIYKNVYY